MVYQVSAATAVGAMRASVDVATSVSGSAALSTWAASVSMAIRDFRGLLAPKVRAFVEFMCAQYPGGSLIFEG